MQNNKTYMLPKGLANVRHQWGRTFYDPLNAQVSKVFLLSVSSCSCGYGHRQKID